MNPPKVTLHGAAGTVTGSCYEVSVSGRTILIDCGLFQGSRTLETLNREPFRFDASKLDAVLLTHAHLDHSGLLPRLAVDGFRGPIHCTPATADLLSVMLPDAARIQEQDSTRRNRRPDRADEPAIEPLYTMADAEQILDLLTTTPFEQAIPLAPGLEARFWNAGHILGSASVELIAGETRLLFSGDLGPDHKSFLADPQGPHGIDHLFCESTYGDRDRPPVTIEQRRATLQVEIKSALERGGNMIIPVFALERTQELLLDIASLSDSGRLPQPRVFIDSPLASRATEIFRRYAAELEDVSGDVFRHSSFHFIEGVDESIRLNKVSGAIILAASGMCEGGRIRHHLRHNLPRSDSTILFVGYQAGGTLGKAIVEGARRVRISGRDVAVRAQIRRIDSYSAHADREELLNWIKDRQPIRGSLFLTHGENMALESLRRDAGRYASSIIVPEIGERYELPAGEPAGRLTTGRVELRGVIARDWQNEYADFVANMKRDLQRIESGEQRAEAVARMRKVLRDYADHREQQHERRHIRA